MSEPQLMKNSDENRYELYVDGSRIGFVDYRRDDDVIDLTHTEVDPEHGGNGYAAQLAVFALDDAREAGLTVIPTCSYIARYIERHPAYADLLVTRTPTSD